MKLSFRGAAAFFLLLICSILEAQSISNLSSQKADDLSDEQISEMVKEAKAMGYSEIDLLLLARQQGFSQEEIEKLGERISQQEAPRVATGGAIPGDRFRIAMEDSLELLDKDPLLEERIKLIGYFGYSIFNREAPPSFQSSLQQPSPENYILGPGDEVYIDIYGASEKYYEAPILSEGQIVIENFGPIFIGGLSLKEASLRIKSKVGQFYKGLLGSNPDTYLQVTLGSLKAINVNVLGEVHMPGTYTMTSFATVFNALYASGGPNLTGSLRNVQVFRGGKLQSTIDIYDILINGATTSNIYLLDGDVILVPPFIGRVGISGEVKRPSIFEMKPNETVADLLRYAGGFNDNAYRGRIALTRNTSKEKVVSDIYEDQFSLFTLSGGDDLVVGKILDRFENRVQIVGSVYRPGTYALTDGMTLSKLVEKADGLTGDAFAERALITRIKEDLSTETIPVDLRKVLNGESADISLLREDVLMIQSIYDLKEEQYVKISGEVGAPGTFAFSQGITVSDLIFKSRGFLRSAAAGTIEISRRVPDQRIDNQREIILLSVDESLQLNSNDDQFALMPFDHVMVRRNPNYFEERIVKVTGEVMFPGNYALVKEKERLSDVIRRAGGLRPLAYSPGATLIRRTEFFDLDSDNSAKLTELKALLNRIDTNNLSEADARLRLSLLEEIAYAPDLSNENLSTRAKKDRLNEIAKRSSFLTEMDIKSSEPIPLNLDAVMRTPGSQDDFILEEGDIISVPKQMQTVRLRGRVLYPTTARYEDDMTLKDYISQAGGYDSRAMRRKTYVVYANGEVARTRQFLFFRSSPKVEPGAEVIVPTKPPKAPATQQLNQFVGLGTSLMALLLTLNNLR